MTARNLTEARIAALLQEISTRAFCDAAVPADGRNLLVRMQASLMRLARADMDFFFEEGHVARRLVQALIGIALGCDPAGSGGDAHYRMLEGLVGRMCNTSSPDALSCASMLSEAEAFFVQENAAVGEALQRMIGDAVREEGQLQARAFAENEIAARLENGEAAGFVEDFLQTHWLRVLEFGFGVRDARPEVLPTLLETMDALVWSVRPKAGAEERKELLDRLPPMLAMLNAWLDVIEWQDAGREVFFAALAAHHAAAMRATTGLTPRDQLEMRMDVVQRASEHQLTRRAREDRQAALAEFMPPVDGLVPGSWVELVRNNGGRVNCRVLWVSPARRRFVFVAASMRRLFMLSEETLAQALRVERAGVIAPDRMVGKALAAVLEHPGAA